MIPSPTFCRWTDGQRPGEHIACREPAWANVKVRGAAGREYDLRFCYRHVMAWIKEETRVRTR